MELLHSIAAWVEDDSLDSPNVYWLFGPAGSGKSTIAFTIANRFDTAGVGANTATLGGNFFCSRQFEETKQSRRIVRTIAYHLSLACTQFAYALSRSIPFDSAYHDVDSQLQNLLVKPWKASARDRAADPSSPPYHLVIIDALDELDGKGGSEFLRILFTVLNKGELPGLKFFATSRPDPALVSEVYSFETKRLYRLQDVGREGVTDDIRIYLTSRLPHFAKRQEIGILAAAADGLFIHASTLVRYLERYQPSEQEMLLTRFLVTYPSFMPRRSEKDVTSLDGLYFQILDTTFDGMEEYILNNRLRILYTFLCMIGRTSTPLVAALLGTSVDAVDAVIDGLHAVLYTDNGQVLLYHKSFSDFLFHRSRSGKYWCDQAVHNQFLAECCFRIMMTGLKFNLANIPSSFILDLDNPTLPVETARCLPPVLSYSCQNWAHYLCFSAPSLSQSLLDILTEFFQISALFWIEAMNLLGLVLQCSSILQEVGEWVWDVSITFVRFLLSNLHSSLIPL